VWLEFVFDYNMEYTDIFDPQVKTVDVFIFESNGEPAQVGAYTRIPVTDFNENTPVAGTYQLKADKVIETLTGPKRIYVGINVPFASFAGNEAALLIAVDDIVTMSTEATGFTMFSDVEPADLTIEDDPSTTTVIEANTVAFQVRRVASKVATSTKQDIYTKNWTDTEAPLELVYNINDFRVFQHTLDSYVAPNYWSVGGIAKTLPGIATTPINTAGDVFSDFPTDATGTAAAIGLHPTLDEDIIEMEGFYIGENYPVENSLPLALNGNSTYAMVSTSVTVDMYATWVDDDTSDPDPTTNPTVGHVEWIAMPAGETYGFGSATNPDIFVVQTGTDGHFVTNSLANASAIAFGYGFDAANSDVDHIYKYTGGYVHFQVYLNREDINNYAILRNQFVHVRVNDIIAQNFLFPGYPGNPADPTEPTDPTDEDPENPDPLDPTDPIDGAPAYLQVEVEPLPWTYKVNDTVLQ
jgi:hypothetical protein